MENILSIFSMNNKSTLLSKTEDNNKKDFIKAKDDLSGLKFLKLHIENV